MQKVLHNCDRFQWWFNGTLTIIEPNKTYIWTEKCRKLSIHGNKGECSKLDLSQAYKSGQTMQVPPVNGTWPKDHGLGSCLLIFCPAIFMWLVWKFYLLRFWEVNLIFLRFDLFWYLGFTLCRSHFVFSEFDLKIY